jgi:hypothetical protein
LPINTGLVRQPNENENFNIMMEYVVDTIEDMLVRVTDTTGQITDLSTSTSHYDIYHDGEALLDGNAVVLNAAPQDIDVTLFRLPIAPDGTWGAGQYALYLWLTDIPGRPEKPRIGPFRFGVIA